MISKNFLAATLVMASMASVATAALTLPLSEDFDGVGDAALIDYNGAYSNIVTDATAPSGDSSVLDVNDGSGHQTVFFADDEGTLSDYRVTANVYVPSVPGADWSRFGIQVRCQANDNYTVDGIYFILDSDGVDYMRISRRVGGSYSTVEQQTETYTLDAWHELKVECQGDSMIAYLDEVEVYNNPTLFADEGFAAGYIGMYNYMAGSPGAHSLFDDILIEDLSGSGVDNWQLLD